MEEKFSEFEVLQKDNEKLREEITKIIGFSNPLWIKINELIENELEQEKLCNQ